MCVCVFVCVENVAMFWFARHISLWGSVSFYLAVLVNVAVALFYPFGDDGDEGEATRLCTATHNTLQCHSG